MNDEKNKKKKRSYLDYLWLRENSDCRSLEMAGVDVDDYLRYLCADVPDVLYHVTTLGNANSILEDGRISSHPDPQTCHPKFRRNRFRDGRDMWNCVHLMSDYCDCEKILFRKRTEPLVVIPVLRNWLSGDLLVYDWKVGTFGRVDERGEGGGTCYQYYGDVVLT